MAAASESWRREDRPNTQGGHLDALQPNNETITLGAREQRLAVHQNQTVEMRFPPRGSHLCAVVPFVGGPGQPLAPDGPGFVVNLLENGLCGGFYQPRPGHV